VKCQNKFKLAIGRSIEAESRPFGTQQAKLACCVPKGRLPASIDYDLMVEIVKCVLTLTVHLLCFELRSCVNFAYSTAFADRGRFELIGASGANIRTLPTGLLQRPAQCTLTGITAVHMKRLQFCDSSVRSCN